MPKFVKYIAIAIGVLIALLLILIGVIVATFNPNDHKPTIIKLVQEEKQRTLAIPGDIKLTFFPKIGADLGKISLSERKSSAEFASVNSAKVSLAFWPLLSKNLVVDRVAVDGLNVNLTRFKDGSTNIDDLLAKDEADKQDAGKQEAGQGAIKFGIDSVHISNARVMFDDQLKNRKIELANVNIDTDEIANNVRSKISVSADIRNDQPKADIKLAVKSGFKFDLEKKHYVMKGIDASVTGALLDYTGVILKAAGNADVNLGAGAYALDGIALSAHAKQANQVIDAKFELPNLVVTKDKLDGSKISGDIKMTEGPNSKSAQLSGVIAGDIDKMLFTSPQLALTLDGKQGETAISGSLTTPLSANLKTQVFELSKIAAAFNLPNPKGGTIKLKADGQASVDLDKQSATTALKGSLDESAFDVKLGVAKFSPLALTFDIGIDKIDVDRYQSKPPAAATPQKAGPEEPIDLSALKTLNVKGSLKVGALKAENIKSTNVRVDVHAAKGLLEISPLSANLYGGSVAGSIVVTATGTPHFAVKQNLTGVNIGPLLKDAIDKQPIDGKGNVQLDITTQGALVSQMKKALAGTAQLELRDGAVHGINLAQTIRNAKAKLGGGSEQSGTGSAGEKTDFSEMKASFKIANGIARNDDLSAKSPLIRVGGAGDINIPDEKLDYLVKATVVTTLQGQGGPELQALKGVTIPVKLSGPFTAIGWKIDFNSLVTDAAKQKVEAKKEEVKVKAKEELKRGLKNLLGK